MAIAVDRNADREAGSNPAARRARGLENMTLRPVKMSLPPDEDWIDLTYRAPDKTGRSRVHETRLPWRVFESEDEVLAFRQQRHARMAGAPNAQSARTGAAAGAAASVTASVGAEVRHLLGLDLRTELTRRAKRRLFAPDSLADENRLRADQPPTASPAQAEAGVIPTTRPDELKARVVSTPSGDFGHLRIFTFYMADAKIDEFLDEVVRLLGALPQNGLILDVRGNGGGYVIAAEFLLQFLTPRAIEPEPMQFINTAGTAQVATAEDYTAWRPSIEESIETGAQYSRALPLYPVELVNSAGQLYHGPVVLVTDALCYSATDIFSAGFADHVIGPVLGVDANTGAGGANVVEHADLLTDWKGGPLQPLPGGANFRVALRRSLRVGARAGQPVEDLGVVPDELHDVTRRDLLEDNADLVAHAGRLLAAQHPRRLTVEATRDGDKLVVALDTTALTSVDLYLAGRPVTSTAVDDGHTSVTVSVPPGATTLTVKGFDGDDLVANRLVTIAASMP
jgi:hypothetical protein